ncbi:MAG: Histone acetyltransferase complex subunit [Alectoria fallacina]|uniref:Histone acetyltransferase complex subunit n=1 Tax=Alectoria fallacina TaxID=1903189 RepID=A0A8H3J9M8_9LECA|nr:MAG: Histone acetyltransferase complex subunit [Alectoria fallacina]
MSNRQNPSPAKRTPRPSTPEAEGSFPSTPYFDEAAYRCTCDTPDASGNWICCDSDDCPVGWHHWECVWVTEEPSGDWLCPRCSLKSNTEAEIQKQRTVAKMSMFPKLGKTAAIDLIDTLDRENRSGQVVRAKRGIAIKKGPPKKERSKWIGWVEMTSEDEDDPKQSIFASQEADFVAEEKQTKARATQSKGRPTRSRTVKGTPKAAAGAKKEGGIESDEEEIDQENPTRKADPEPPFHHHHHHLLLLGPIPRQPDQPPPKARKTSTPVPNPSPKPPNPPPPALSSQTTHSLPTTAPSPNQDSPFATTVRHPSDVPSMPLTSSAAAMVIDTDEQGRTPIDNEERGRAAPIITSTAPDGSSSVDYWSYRTNTWSTIPLSAMRSTLPRLL